MQSKNPPTTRPTDAHATRAPGHAQRSETMRRKICTAVVASLDDHGYSATSISRVQAIAGVSRGAMTHQFPSKEDMMVATLEQLLAPVRGRGRGQRERLWPKAGEGAQDLEQELVRIWTRVVDTREGRALVEILVAARTDLALQEKTAASLHAYQHDVTHNIVGLTALSQVDADELATLWTICRAFLRGLHLQRRFDGDAMALQKVIERFARIMAPHLQAHEPV